MSSNTIPQPSLPRQSSYRMDLVFGMFSRLFYAASRLALPPLVLAKVQVHEYGLWSVAFVLVGYVGMSASGFANVYLRQVSKSVAAGDMRQVSQILSTGIVTVGLFSLGVYGLLWANMDALLSRFHVPESDQALARTLWLGATAVFLADLSLGAFASTLHAIGQIRTEQKIWLLACTVELACIVILLQCNWGISSLLWAFAIRYALSAALAARCVARSLPGLRLRVSLFDTGYFKTFVKDGGGIQLSDLASTMLHSIDRVLSGILIGPHAVAFFDLASKLPVTAGSIASSVSSVTTSTAARQSVTTHARSMQDILDEATRFNVLVLGLSLPFMAGMGQTLVHGWLGASSAAVQLAIILPMICLGWHAHLLTGPVSAVFRGQGQVRPDFVYHLLRVLSLTMAVGVWLAYWRGHIAALAVAMSFAQVSASGFYLIWARRQIRGDGAQMLRAVWGPSLGAYVVALGLHMVFDGQAPVDRWHAAQNLVLAVTVWAVVMGGLIWQFFLTLSQRNKILHWVKAHALG